MDLFNREKLSKFAETAGSAIAGAAKKAAAATKTAAVSVKEFASEATEHAKHGVHAASNKIMGGSHALSLVGTEVTVRGKVLRIESLLAEGGFASVYLASFPNGQRFVLKKMFAGGAETIAQLTNEVRLMSSLDHPNIVKVLASESRPSPSGRDGIDILVVMEYCPGGHLLSRINKQSESGGHLPYPKIFEVFANIVRPVAYLHARDPPVTHRDLKFENVLIAADGSLRLCDFGSATTFRGAIDRSNRAREEDAITRFTTPHFRSPEMVDLYSGLPLDERSDVWALGCMLFGLAYFKHPFQPPESGPLAILAARYKIPYAPAYPPPVITAIRACLSVHPDGRPTAAQLLAYVEACAGAPAEGPYPPLRTSGGGVVAAAALPPPPPPPTLYDGTLGPQLSYFEVVGAPGAVAGGPGSGSAADAFFGAAGDGGASGMGMGGRRASFGADFTAAGAGGAAGAAGAGHAAGSAVGAAGSFASGAAGSTATGAAPGGGAPRPGGYHVESAAEIAAKVAAASAAAGGAPSSSLAARLAARRGGAQAAAPAAAAVTPAAAAAASHAHAASSGAAAAPAAPAAPSTGRAAAVSGSAAADFDFDFGSSGVAAASSVSPTAAAAGGAAASVSSGGSGSGSGAPSVTADDFGLFDAFGPSSSSSSSSSNGSSSAAPAPAPAPSAAARRPSGASSAAAPAGLASADDFAAFDFGGSGPSAVSSSAGGHGRQQRAQPAAAAPRPSVAPAAVPAATSGPARASPAPADDVLGDLFASTAASRGPAAAAAAAADLGELYGGAAAPAPAAPAAAAAPASAGSKDPYSDLFGF